MSGKVRAVPVRHNLAKYGRGPRRFLIATVVGLPLVLTLRGEGRPAWAGEPSKDSTFGATSRPPIERIDGATGPLKEAKGPVATGSVPSCALEAYAKLETETKVLAASYGDDVAGFRAAYAARKRDLVGQAAMDARGCKGGTP